VLTSATSLDVIPAFLQLDKLVTLDFSKDTHLDISYKVVFAVSKDKLESLFKLLCTLKSEKSIVFINYKDAISRISDYLDTRNVNHGAFHGSLDQKERERTLIQFRNGSINILLATDLAARGIDILDIDSVIHYHFPHKEQEFIHRNGRTARMKSAGDVYLLRGKDELLPDYLDDIDSDDLKEEDLQANIIPIAPRWSTLYVSAGRKDKISKGDLAGMFFKQGGLEKGELGIIDLKQECAFVAVPRQKAQSLTALLDNCRVKKRKVRIRPV